MGIHVHKGMGLVSQVFDETDIEALKGNMAIGHTRYSTAGGSKLACHASGSCRKSTKQK